MIDQKTLIPELDKFLDIKLCYDLVKKHNSSIESNPKCFINNSGLKEYLEYNKNSLKFIHKLSLIESGQIYKNLNRSNKRSLQDILINALTGNLGELSYALDYNISYAEFERQMIEKRELNSATAYDLLNNEKRVEIKTIRHNYLYNSDKCIPIDTSNDGIHPKYWREKLGKFDYLAAFYVWNGRFRPLGELSWNLYYYKSFFYGTGKGEYAQKYLEQTQKNHNLRRKIMIPIDDLDPVYTN